MSEYFSVFTHQWWNYLLPATQSVTGRQRRSVYVSVDKVSSAVSKQVHRNMTDNGCFLDAASSTFPRLYCVTLDVLLSPSVYSPFFFLSPSPLLSPDIKPLWRLCKCVQLSSIYSLFRASRFYLFFFPPPLCGRRPISSVRAPGFGWEYYHSFGIAHPNPSQTSVLQL